MSRLVLLLFSLPLALLLTSVVVPPLPLYAQEGQSCQSSKECQQSGYYCKSGQCACIFGFLEAPLPGFSPNQSICQIVQQGNTPIIGIASVLVRLVTALIIGAALVIIVVAGFVYMSAGGDASRVGLAKKMIGRALLGIVLALGAFLLLNTISPQFAENIQEPQLGN